MAFTLIEKCIAAIFPAHKDALMAEMDSFLLVAAAFPTVNTEQVKSWNSGNVAQLLDTLYPLGCPAVYAACEEQELLDRDDPEADSVITEMEILELENMINEADDISHLDKMKVLLAFRYVMGQTADSSMGS